MKNNVCNSITKELLNNPAKLKELSKKIDNMFSDDIYSCLVAGLLSGNLKDMDEASRFAAVSKSLLLVLYAQGSIAFITKE